MEKRIITIEDLEKSESIKNSKFFDVIKKNEVKKMSNSELEELKLFILSLNDEEIEMLLIKILDDEYQYQENNTEENDKIEEFLSDIRFEKYYDKILSEISDNE